MFVIRINEGEVPDSPENSAKGALKVVWQQGLHSWDCELWQARGSWGACPGVDPWPPPPLVLGRTGSSLIGAQVQLRGPEPSLSRACVARLACFILVFSSTGPVLITPCLCLFTLTAMAVVLQ